MNTELSQLANLYNGRIVIVNSQFRVVKDTYDLDEGKFIISEDVLKCFRGEDTLNYDKKGGFIEMTLPVVSSVSQEKIGMMIVSTPTEDILASRDTLSRKVFILQVGMALAILAIAFYVSRMLVKPFGKVTRSLEEMTGGILEEDLSDSGLYGDTVTLRGLQPDA